MHITDCCIGCGVCIPYCTIGAIFLKGDKAVIDQERCVECSECLRSECCPVDALELLSESSEYPRSVRMFFSDPMTTHKETGISGRGTAEVKTNDVTGRIKRGDVGFCIELGRPGVGTSLRDVEKVAMSLSRLDMRFEEKNPILSLMEDRRTGRFKNNVLGERLLSIIIEFITDIDNIPNVIEVLRRVEKEIDTVFSLSLICRVNPNGSVPAISQIKELGLIPRPNCKTNVGLGRPLVDL